MQMPLPATMSMPSLTMMRARSVTWYLAMAEITDGFSPASRDATDTLRTASQAYRCPAMRASGACTPSNLPMGRPNCLRIAA
ncbi:hypothetical protein PFLmoz3_02456 [Pseudomonas fluorescens]|uniref:Uncharacterized protein n=1 Tax=Pseudomonas fluorescens TaxID=294 RepID=A0A125QII6_PSEFL|nr:hypothetical protein PFLmoz3_02456 [Pseudomonas fluorescens]